MTNDYEPLRINPRPFKEGTTIHDWGLEKRKLMTADEILEEYGSRLSDKQIEIIKQWKKDSSKEQFPS